MNFMYALAEESTRDQFVLTENGAVSYATTGKKLLDLNFAVSSFRRRSDDAIVSSFMDAFSENPDLAMIWLFYLRDCRGGMGERRFFRIVLNHLASVPQYAGLVIKVLPLIPEYGRWDDMLFLLNTCCHQVRQEIMKVIVLRLIRDIDDMKAGRPVSLLAKWMPSDNTSSQNSRRLAKYISHEMGYSVRLYRKVLTGLRAHMKVLECDLSANRWGEVDYSAVPSQANLLYRKAFMKHDEARRTAYLESLASGNSKINASTLFPHDIVHKYVSHFMSRDDSLEALWSALPDYVQGESGTLVVRDGSGSMGIGVGGGSSVTAMSVSTALAVYFAERCRGPYKDQFITFSSRPRVVSIKGLATLQEKLARCYKETDCSNTNIEAVFKLILDTAVKNKCRQEDLPSTVLVISDMEFDYATTTYKYGDMVSLFDKLRELFKENGYTMPKLAFWNVCSRTNGIPVRENENGVVLVSGFSPAAVKMVLQEETDPYLALTNILSSARYSPVFEALK